jgi:uncharacterized LabA/DUF88 family protein
MINKAQRVGVFVDVQNLFYSSKNLYKKKVNFNEIMKNAVKQRNLIRAFAYVIKADIKEQDKFFNALSKIGFEIKSKDLQTFIGGHQKGDWDVGLAMDAIRMSSKLDVVVLVSGDGDFKELIEYLKAGGCRVEVMAFNRTCSHKLKEVTDEFIDLEKSKRYLITKAKKH